MKKVSRGTIFCDEALSDSRQDKYLIYIGKKEKQRFFAFYDKTLRFFRIKTISEEKYHDDSFICLGESDVLQRIGRLYLMNINYFKNREKSNEL